LKESALLGNRHTANLLISLESILVQLLDVKQNGHS